MQFLFIVLSNSILRVINQNKENKKQKQKNKKKNKKQKFTNSITTIKPHGLHTSLDIM